MRVNEAFQAGVRVDSQHDVQPAHVLGSATRSVPTDSSSYAAAPELAQLLARVSEIDEVRPELVDEVSRRLAAGVYESRAAAEQTAERIVQSAV